MLIAREQREWQLDLVTPIAAEPPLGIGWEKSEGKDCGQKYNRWMLSLWDSCDLMGVNAFLIERELFRMIHSIISKVELLSSTKP
jgi:hypothetical protein